jgi:hypothetical protein
LNKVERSSAALQTREAGLTPRDLRWIADAYDQAQRVRVQAGERIRAILQGRDGRLIEPSADANAELRDIRLGKSDGPVPLLGRTYRRHWEEEQDLRAAMEIALLAHPVWPWLSQVRGIGATLAARLLARLDIERAPTPSSFWSYCGLATVPAEQYHCAVCDRKVLSADRTVRAQHRNASGATCSGELVRVETAEVARMAQPVPRRGEPAVYDRQAKKLCYLIGVSFLRARSSYRAIYDEERARLERERPGWSKGRQHLAALRKMEKLFLSHLWSRWAEATGMPRVRPYAYERALLERSNPPKP